MAQPLVGILLCGGASRRFGSNKLLAGDPPIAARAAANLRAALARCIAVVPLEAGALAGLLEQAGCEVLATDRTVRGMGASLAAAVESAAGASGWIVALGDMPSIEPGTIARVRDAVRAGARIAVPVLADGRRGHPVGFAGTLRSELVALDGDLGARELIRQHDRDIVRVACGDEGIVLDVDVAGDLDRLPR